VDEARANGLTVSYPRGAFYMLVDIGGQPNDSLTFSRGLLEAERVAVAPGCGFGSLCDRYVRVSLCASEAALREGIRRLARYLSAVSARPRVMAVSQMQNV